jgi:hypothetical protein
LNEIVSIENITGLIYLIRSKKVMLDRDLAELYGVETKRLKEQVRRNIERFPDDFMFELSKSEFTNWRSQFATSNRDKIGLRYSPMAFTEHGKFQVVFETLDQLLTVESKPKKIGFLKEEQAKYINKR